MSEVKVNKISPRTACGTVTLGDSGDTIALGAGASQTGFGRTGTVDWQTGSIKTSTFTAANGEGYFANTSGSAFTMNLPAGSAGAIVSVVDYTNTFQTNSLTISPNGSEKIGGVAADFVAAVEGQSLTFVYVDGTEGWKNIQDSTTAATGNPNLVATGGTITTCGNFKIHKFTGPGTFTVQQVSQTAADNTVSYLVVAGGGAGGSNRSGGGGGGGFREYKGPVDSYTASPLNGNPGGTAITVTAQGYPITVGAGGGGNNASSPGSNGNPSVFSTVTSTAGGGAGSGANGAAGGSGGGSGCRDGAPYTGGAGNTPPVSPSQGFPGGSTGGGSPGPYRGAGAGGGGATEAGVTNPNSYQAQRGGAGANTSISGTPTAYSGGGGGGAYANAPGSPGVPTTGTAGGASPCGTGTAGKATAGSDNAGANSGGGSGAAGINFSPPSTVGLSGNGGSGVVIIRYKFQ